MALNFLDYALSVGAGIAEKDMADMKEERNANFNLALEEFKDNKALITKLAENRYARDVNRYDKEFEKFDNLKQVYSQVANNELSAKAAAYKIASFELCDLPLIKYVARKNKPILMSTGKASLEEIEDAISKTENLPESLKYVNDRKEKFELLANDIEKVKKYVMNSI